MSDENKKPLDGDLVRDFILATHAKLGKVKAFYEKEPNLIRSSWDWGEGDWENGLEAAGHMGHRDIAEFLLSKGAAQTIFSAAMLGEEDIVEALLKADPESVNRVGVHGISLIYHVALSGKVKIAERLQECGTLKGLDSSLHAAVKFGHIEMVDWLLSQGVKDINILNFQKQTPLAAALESGKSEIADLISKSGGHE